MSEFSVKYSVQAVRQQYHICITRNYLAVELKYGLGPCVQYASVFVHIYVHKTLQLCVYIFIYEHV